MAGRIWFAAAAAAMMLAGGASAAQTRRYEVTVRPLAHPKGFEKVSVSRAALGSSPVVLWQNTAIDPDCSLHPPGTTLTVVTPPAHGEVKISDEPFYAAFPKDNPRSACNDRKVPGHQAFYTAQAGFRGHDRMVLQGSSGQGVVREIKVDVDVR